MARADWVLARPIEGSIWPQQGPGLRLSVRQFRMDGLATGVTSPIGPGQDPVGTQEPWNPKGTRAGRWTTATGGPANEVASKMIRSLAFLVPS